jgi:hypothetical protein
MGGEEGGRGQGGAMIQTMHAHVIKQIIFLKSIKTKDNNHHFETSLPFSVKGRGNVSPFPPTPFPPTFSCYTKINLC